MPLSPTLVVVVVVDEDSHAAIIAKTSFPKTRNQEVPVAAQRNHQHRFQESYGIFTEIHLSGKPTSFNCNDDDDEDDDPLQPNLILLLK